MLVSVNWKKNKTKQKLETFSKSCYIIDFLNSVLYCQLRLLGLILHLTDNKESKNKNGSDSDNYEKN